MHAKAPTASPVMSGPEKAAAFLLLAGQETAARLADHFSEDELRAIFAAAGRLQSLTVEEIEALIEEFHNQFDRNAMVNSRGNVESLFAGMRPGVDFSEFVNGSVGPAVEEVPLPSWDDIARAGIDPLVAFVTEEHPQSGAYLISRLDQPVAARVIGQLPPELRRVVVVRLVEIKPPAGPLGEEMDRLIRERFARKRDDGVDTGAIERIAGMVNELPVEQAEEIMAVLDAANADKAERIRKMLFRFEDVEALAQEDRAILFDGLSADEMAQALFGASESIKEAVLSVLSQRNRRSVEAELADARYSEDLVVDTRRRIAKRALSLSLEGKIRLTASD